MSKICLKKIDVAIAQVNTAIKLWMHNEDEISIHTLICSAYQIINDINIKTNNAELLYNSELIKDEHKQGFVKFLKEVYNFSKHADSDTFSEIEFDSQKNILFISFCCIGLEKMNIQPDAIRSCFISYYMLHFPEYITEKGRNEINLIDQSQKEIVFQMTREEYYNLYQIQWKIAHNKRE